jgi:hypothetical protein
MVHLFGYCTFSDLYDIGKLAWPWKIGMALGNWHGPLEIGMGLGKLV